MKFIAGPASPHLTFLNMFCFLFQIQDYGLHLRARHETGMGQSFLAFHMGRMLKVMLCLGSAIYENCLIFAMAQLYYLMEKNHPIWHLFDYKYTIFNEEAGEMSFSLLQRFMSKDTMRSDFEHLNTKYKLVPMFYECAKDFKGDLLNGGLAETLSVIETKVDSAEVRTLGRHFNSVIDSMMDGTWMHYKTLRSERGGWLFQFYDKKVTERKGAVKPENVPIVYQVHSGPMFDKAAQKALLKIHKSTLSDDYKALFSDDFEPAVAAVAAAIPLRAPDRRVGVHAEEDDDEDGENGDDELVMELQISDDDDPGIGDRGDHFADDGPANAPVQAQPHVRLSLPQSSSSAAGKPRQPARLPLHHCLADGDLEEKGESGSLVNAPRPKAPRKKKPDVAEGKKKAKKKKKSADSEEDDMPKRKKPSNASGPKKTPSFGFGVSWAEGDDVDDAPPDAQPPGDETEGDEMDDDACSNESLSLAPLPVSSRRVAKSNDRPQAIVRPQRGHRVNYEAVERGSVMIPGEDYPLEAFEDSDV